MQDLSQRTVTFLLKNKKVLLGYKKTGFGSGNYLGIGGKIESGETNEQAAVREITEEITVTKPELVKVADLTFLFPEKPNWSQQVHVYICKKWDGQPTETSEIRPEWFETDNLPLNKMWDDAHFWLPAVLDGHILLGTFTFNNDLKVVHTELKETA